MNWNFLVKNIKKKLIEVTIIMWCTFWLQIKEFKKFNIILIGASFKNLTFKWAKKSPSNAPKLSSLWFLGR